MKRRTKLTLLSILLVFVVLLVILRLAAPVMAERYLNEELLSDLGDYSGRVDDVSFALWRSTVRLEGMHIEKVTGNEWVEFVTVPAIDVSLSPLALFQGIIRVQVVIEEPEINFVDAETAEDMQTGAGLEFPVDPEPDPDPRFEFHLEKLEIRQGMVAFRNFTSEPPVNLQAQEIDLTATNLTAIADEEDRPRGEMEATAMLFGHSPFSAEAEFDPSDFQNFLFAGELEMEDIRAVNPFVRAYANLDFNSGEGNMVVEVRAEEGQLTGYAKPAFENVSIFDWREDVEEQDKGLFQLAWERVAEAGASLFSHPRTDILGTRIDISGEIPDDPEVDTWGAVFGIVRNAFVEAMDPTFEGMTPFDVEAEDAEED